MDSLEIERTHQYQVFDGSLDSIFVLRSVREDSCLVQNFVIDYANQRAIDVGGRPITTLVGRLFTDAYPEAVEMGLWTFFGRSLNPASPTRTTTSTTALRSTAFTPRDGSICKLTQFEGSVIVAFRDVTSQRERDRQWADERAQAVAIQRAFIPDELPEFPGLKVAAAYAPASGAHLGGDWFDCFLVDDSVVMIVGDVAGHGIHSAAVMGELRNAARAICARGSRRRQIVSRVNRMLCRLEPNELASMIVAVWDPLTGMLNRCTAGHPPLLRCRKGETDFLDSSPGVLLGVDENSSTNPPQAAPARNDDCVLQRWTHRIP